MSFMTENLSNQIPTVLAMLGIICIIGTCGNLLVIIVYSLKHDRLTSTVFILILAISDFLSCLILIPGTMAIEYLEWKFDSTFLCKFYYFNNNAFIPFSSLLITCIAFDRYFCLCHPFKKIMNRSRARRLIAILILISVLLGICSTFTVRIAKADSYDPPISIPKQQQQPQSPTNLKISDIGISHDNEQLKRQTVQNSNGAHKTEMFECTEIVKLNSSGLEKAIYQIVQKSQTVSYIMCILSVIVLYVLIYRSVSKVFKKRLELKGGAHRSTNAYEKSMNDISANKSISKPNNGTVQAQLNKIALSKHASKSHVKRIGPCLDQGIIEGPDPAKSIGDMDEDFENKIETQNPQSLIPSVQIQTNEDSGHELNKTNTDDDKKISIQPDNLHLKPKKSFLKIPDWKRLKLTRNSTTMDSKSEASLDNLSQIIEADPKSCTNNHDRSRKSMKSLKDTIAFQNLKTAAMLFVVAVVYIVTFIPAMLMASDLVPLYLPIFYLYYVNNSINPIIYGFMNPNFRNDIRELLCKRLKCVKPNRHISR